MIRIEKAGSVWTVIHSLYEQAKNAVGEVAAPTNRPVAG
jgi:hypothetical protein